MSDLKWWQRPVRMMRRDYMTDLQRMRDADLDELARGMREDWHINCEWVIATPGVAPGLGWQTTFNTDKFHKYEALGDWDLIREYLPFARKYGLHLLGYLNMHWYSYDFAAAHPGWEQVDAQGTPYGRLAPLYGSGTTLCVNSDWREWALELVREAMRTGLDGVFLDGPVIYPGCCYCPVCRAKFEARFGAPIPETEDWSDPVWKQFILFREDSMAEFLRDCRAALLEVNPEGILFLNGGSWHGGGWRVARDIEKVGPYEDLNGAEAFFHPGPRHQMLYFWATAAKHLRAAGKPAVVFSHHALGSWHYLPLPPVEAKLAAAQTVACGANPWIAIFDYAMDQAAEETLTPIQEINGFLEANEEYCTAAESAATVALLFSSQSAKFYVSRVDDLFADTAATSERDLIMTHGSGQIIADLARRKSLCDGWQHHTYQGWFEVLTREHIPFDVLLDTGLTPENLGRYQTLILANATCLSDAQLAAIRAFAANGGNVVAEFEAGEYDELGNPRESNPLRELLGVAGVEGAFVPATAEEYVEVGSHPAVGFRSGRWLPRPVNCLQVRVAADATAPARVLEPIGKVYTAPRGVSEWPAMVCREGLPGRAVYFPCLAAAMYGQYALQDHQQWLADAVRWAHAGAMPLWSEAPGTVQMELWRQPGRLVLHLVNNTGDGIRPIAETIPVHDVVVHVQAPPGATARAVSGVQLAQAYADGALRLHLPRLDLYEIVVIEGI